MEILLIRHGQSENNARPTHERIEDPSLTDAGYRQAALTAEWLAHMDVERLLTSAFLRTMETTDAIRRSTGLVPQVWTELHEQGGCISGHKAAGYVGQPGMSRMELQDQFPGFKLPREVNDDGWWKCQSYESVELAQDRAARIALRMREELVPHWHRVAVVAHGTIGRLLINHLLESVFLDAAWEQDLYNASVTTLTFQNGTTKLLSFNSVGHLPRRLHTK